MNEATIFAAALEKAAPEREAFVADACGSDAKLRRRVEALLRAHAEADDLLDPPEPITGAYHPVSEVAGTAIGPYKLLEQIGEGGFGVVFMAEQTEPVRRKVALKILKPGMDTRQVVARFEAERQALAIMDHPNIAKVLDGGATASGRPYFVMELVKGSPITEYCDQHQLTPRERLELFIAICQAVQHAHQKGIIHRDLKPSNVLVSRQDTTPLVKVIDFGVAKALGHELTDKTLFTGIAQMIGTPLYMSPEQAGTSDLDVDTRSDIYSLGVLLYELLTGSTPFDKERLKQAAYDEMRRIIREEEPPKPSTRLSESKDSLPSISAQRHMEPAKLTKLMRGELDWIVMKALEKDRNRRYETANGFAMDVQRYLADEPVQACPPSVGYRLQKFAKRNKVGLGVAALVLFSSCCSAAASAGRCATVRRRRPRRPNSRRRGRHVKVAVQVESILNEVGQLEKEQKWPEALTVARRAGAAVAGGEADDETAELVRQRLKDLEFIDRLEQIRMKRGEEYLPGTSKWEEMDREYAEAFRDYGGDVDELTVEASIQRLKARPALAIPIAAALDEWVFRDELAVEVFRQRVSFKGDDASRKRRVAIAHGIDPEPLRDWLRSRPYHLSLETQEELRRLAESINVRAHDPATLSRLARALGRVKLKHLAIRVLRDAQIAYPGDFWLNAQLSDSLEDNEAIRFITVAMALRPSTDAFDHWYLGSLLQRRGDLDQAVAVWRAAIALNPKGERAPYGDLGSALRRQGKPDEAIAIYHKAIEARPEAAGYYWHAIGDTLVEQKKPAEAADAYRKAVDAHWQAIEARTENAGNYVLDIGRILKDQGKPDDAVAAYRKAIELGSKPAWLCWRALGDALRDQKKFDEAVAAYHQAAIAAGGEAGYVDLSLWQAIGDIRIAQGKSDEAVATYRQAIETRPQDVGHHSLLWQAIGDIRIAQGKSDEAVAAYGQAIKASKFEFRTPREVETGVVDPERASVADLTIGGALRAKGKPDEAVAVYRHGIDLKPEHADAYWNAIGDIRRDQKKLDEAVGAYRKATELKPSASVYHHRLGLALRDQNKLVEANAAFDRAIELYRKARDLTPADRSWNAGVVQRDKGEMDGAIVAFRKALDIDPKHGSAARDLVNALRARGRPDEALDVYRKAFQSDPVGFEHYIEFGNALVQHGKLDEAATVYRKAIELGAVVNLGPMVRSNFAAAMHLGLGNVLSRQNNGPEAIAAYYRAIELDPKYYGAAAYINIGHVLRGWGRLDEDIACCKKAIEINDPKNTPFAHARIGDALVQQKKLEDAIAAYRKAIELAPDSLTPRNNLPSALNELAWALATHADNARRDPLRAVSLAKEAVELKPQESSYWNTLGAAHFRAGDWKAAVSALEKSMVRREGGDSNDWFFLAMALWQLGEKDKAREWYDRAVEWMDKNQPKNEDLRRFRTEAEELMRE